MIGFGLDVPAQVPVVFAVWIDGEPDRVDLVVDHLRTALRRDPRASAAGVLAWLANPPRVDVVLRDDAPLLAPRDVLTATGLTMEAASILERATHVAVVRTTAAPQPPRVGLWGAYVLAVALARAYEGALVDPAALRAFVVGPNLDPLEAAEDDSVAPFVAVAAGRSADGRATIATLGLSRYGLPELLWEDPPENARRAPEAGLLVRTVAQVLVDLATAPGRVQLPGIVRVDGPGLARANDRLDLAGRGVDADVALDASDAKHSDAIRLHPPVGTDPSEWFARALASFSAPRAMADAPLAFDREMDDAMERARASLSTAKSAFAERGEPTYVKRRFNSRSGGRDEFIWVAIDRWNGSTISGRLANTPLGDVGYALDAKLEFDESEAVDWIVAARDGTGAGNFTGAVLAAREGSRARGA